MTPYQVLGVVPGASLDVIKAAYRRRMMQCHPDKGGSEEEAKMVNRAFELLTKPQPEPVMIRRPTVVVRVFTSYSSSYTSTTSTGTYFTW